MVLVKVNEKETKNEPNKICQPIDTCTVHIVASGHVVGSVRCGRRCCADQSSGRGLDAKGGWHTLLTLGQPFVAVGNEA